MKKIRKVCSWVMLLTIVLTNSPLIYAEEIHNAIETTQSEEYHHQSVEEAQEAVVGNQNQNTPEQADKNKVLDAKDKDGGDAIQQPKLPESGLGAEEAALREKYGEPVAQSGQEQLYKVDETHFVTYIGSDVKTYKNQDGQEIPVDLDLYSYHVDGKHYYLPKESPVGVVLPSQVDKETPIDVISQDDKISLYPIDKTYENATVQENAILYNNVEGAMDVQYTVQANGVKEEIVLANWEGKNRFTYGLDAISYDVVLENNQVLVKQKGKDTVLFVLTAPIMVDATGQESQDITLELKKAGKQYELTVVASEDWLKDASRSYPVRIDPTVTVPRENLLDVVTSSVRGTFLGSAYGFVGYITAENMGMPGVADIGRSRMYFKINYDFKKSIPSEAKIDNATLNLYQYSDGKGTANATFAAYRVKQDFDIQTITWLSSLSLEDEISGENALSPANLGMHHFDIRETVNGWVQGLYPNYGLVVKATNEGDYGGGFYTTEANVANNAQGGFTPDKAPSITINWSVPDPVDVNYAIGDTTIHLRNMVKTEKSGKLQFQGVFADGVTTPGSLVTYNLSDAGKNYTGQVPGSFSYKFPDTSSFISAFEKGTTQYKDKLSNWQTIVPFTEPEFNKVYTIDAESQKDGQTSGKKSSDTFVIYKVTQYDTLPKIASYYGVPLKQLAYDNRIQDMLLVKNNTLFIRNPKKNATKPYNPPKLNDTVKSDVDMLLMGRGLHCEFGFEPINLNTGNFYLDRTDISIPDLGGDFEIVRFYNSKAAGMNSLFGRGWSFAFNEQVTSDEEGNLYYTRTDGSILTFKKDGNKYQAPEGYDLTMTIKEVETKKADFGNGEEEYTVKEYRITDSEQQEKIFNFHGLLTSQTDEKGHKTSLDYNEEGILTKITSPTGLIFNVTMTEEGYIGAVGLPNGSTLTYEYDENGNLITYTDATGVPTRYEYDDKGLMTAWYDGNGTKVIENIYDDQGRVTQQTDGSGAVSTLAYSDGQTVATDANGHSTTYTYDKLYRTMGIAYPDGSSVSKTYDEANRLASETNELGQTTSYTYDENGNVLSETRFDGAVKSSTYDSKNHLLSETDFDGNTTSYTYDKEGNLLSTTLADGSKVTYTVDKEGRTLSTTDALGNTTNFAYNGANMVKVTNPLGGVSTLAYNAHNQLVSVTNPRGGVTSYTYDGEGRKMSETDPDGVSTTYSFDGAGQVTGVTEGNGNTSTFSYDGFGRKIAATNGEGGIYSYTYDGVGNQLSMTDAEGHTTTYTYDSRGRLLTETDASGHTTQFKRDGLGRVLTRINEAGHRSSLTYDDRFSQVATITDALDQITENTYDPSGNLTKVTYPIGTASEYSYDKLGRILSYKDESGQTISYTYDVLGRKLTETIGDRTTSYTYDAAGNVTRIIYPDQSSVSYTYDAMGNVLTFTDAKGKKTSYDYTDAGRLLATRDPLGNTTSMGYDKNGNHSSVTDAAGYTASTVYNGQNQVSQVTDGLGNSTQFAYNQMELLTEVTDALGGKTKYTYNELGYPVAVEDANGNTTKISYTATAQIQEVVNADGSTITNEYDALDRLIKQTHSSGLVTDYTYDAANRILSIKDNQDLDETYSYDAVGNRLTTTNSLGQVTSYSYDNVNQLTQTTFPDGSSESYTYDKVGNLATKTDVEGHTITYHYDKNGNLTKTVDHLDRENSYTYDAVNRVVTESDPEGNTISYEYDVLGNLSKVTDANGHTSSYGYDANQHLVLYKDPKGNETALKYDPLGRLIETVAPTGSKQMFTYDALGNTLSQTSGEGHMTSYSYDAMSRVSTMTEPTGGVTSYSYDATGSLVSETDPSGDMTSYINDLYGRATKRTLPNKAVFTYTYDKLGRLEKQTAPQGLSKVYTYDLSGNLTKETDQSDRTTSYTYDVAGRLLTEKNALNLETTYAYDKAGNLTTVTTPSGAKTNLEYTKLDQLKTITSPTGRKTDLSYDPVGQVTKRTINGKREETYAYDPNGNLEKLVNPLGQSQTKTYDALNRLTAETDVAGQTTLYHYDKDDRLTNVTTGSGATASYTYDGNGNLTQVTSGSQRLSTYTYDSENQLLTATKGSGEKASTSTYTYDSVGNMTSVTNGNGQVTKYSYDQLSNMVERMTALGDAETYTYDVNNQLSQIKKADGKTISYDYNKLDQLLTTKYSEKSEGQVLYTYDADGRRVSMSDLTGITNYVYNKEGEMTGVRQGDGSLIQYDYDDYGNIQKLTYPDGSEVKYSYDDLDRLTKVIDKDGKVTTYAYNESGDMTKIVRGDGTKSELTYDVGHRVTTISHLDKKNKLISSYAYEYDDGNFITKETITQDGQTLVQAYSYDSLGQLTNMAISDQNSQELATFSYTYDLAGNRLTSTELAEGKETKSEFSYDANNRLIQVKIGDKVLSYDYDQNGNRVQSSGNDETLDYIYDTENRLLAVKDKEGMLFAALYDGDDNRVFTASRTQATNTYQLFKRKPKVTSPKTSPNGEENSLFWYGFTQNVLQFFSSFASSSGYDWIGTFDTISVAYHQKIAKDRATKEGLVVNPPDEKNLPGQDPVTYASEVQDVLIPYTTKSDTYHYYEVRNYINDVNQEHTQVLETYDDQMKARETYIYGKGRSSYYNHQTGDTYQYLTNQSGSVTGLTKDGQAVASTSYHLYGSTKSTTDQTGNPFAYNGEARDVTGLDYLRARYYDHQVGTFLTEDSYQGDDRDPLSQNLYSYVQNNPVNYTDPSGHRAMGLLGGGGRRVINTRNQRKYSQMRVDPALFSNHSHSGGGYYSAANHIRHRVQSNPSYRPPASYYAAFGPHAAVYQPAQLTSHIYSQQQQRQPLVFNPLTALQQAQANGQSTYNWGKSKSKEARNIHRNWTKALEETQKHICDPKRMKAGDKSSIRPSKKQLQDLQERISKDDKAAILQLIKGWNPKAGIGTNVRTPEEIAAGNKEVKDNFIKGAKDFAGEILSVYDIQRLFTGKDPITGKPADRVTAGFWLAVDAIALIAPFTKLGKVGKGAKAADAVDDASDVVKAAKAVDKVDDVRDSVKANKVADQADMAGNIENTYTPPKGGGGITGELTSGNKRFTFGHGGRHLEGSNLSIEQVQNAIMENASRNLPNVGEGSVSRYIEIGGELIEYRIMNRGDNLYNIGTYFIKRK